MFKMGAHEHKHIITLDSHGLLDAGLDVYSLNTSTQTVISYLERIDPEAAKIAKQRYSCFDRCTCCICLDTTGLLKICSQLAGVTCLHLSCNPWKI